MVIIPPLRWLHEGGVGWLLAFTPPPMKEAFIIAGRVVGSPGGMLCNPFLLRRAEAFFQSPKPAVRRPPIRFEPQIFLSLLTLIYLYFLPFLSMEGLRGPGFFVLILTLFA